MNSQTPLKNLLQRGLIDPLDYQFAELIGRLDYQADERVKLAAALTTHATSAGHVCLDLQRPEGLLEGAIEGDEGLLPVLKRSQVVGDPEGDSFHPLILDRVGRLYLQRYWDYEQRLAKSLLALTRRSVGQVSVQKVKEGLNRLFDSDEEARWQRVAAATALFKSLTIITGGPGTGKTTTLVKILALLQEIADDPELKIALAAPTGKAAARMQESVRQTWDELSVAQAPPAEAMTLHRLLGYRPGRGFRYRADNPLPVDVLIVDEASMIDLALMVRLVEALPEHGRLILLGDRFQLASVEAGSVLADICGTDAVGFSAEFAETIEDICGLSVETSLTGKASRLSDHIVELTHSYRFDTESSIGQLAQVVKRGEMLPTLDLLNTQNREDLTLHSDLKSVMPQIVDGYREYLQAIDRRESPGKIFAAFSRFRVLTALRQGPQGSRSINTMIEHALVQAGLITRDTPLHYPGRPVMITRNDYRLNLFNGDIGIYIKDEKGDITVGFLSQTGDIRWESPSRLPEHESAFCMTVHKSQGSEFDHVFLIMPAQPSPLLTRELLYTAITRSKRYFSMVSSEKIIEKTMSNVIYRMSGLRTLLV